MNYIASKNDWTDVVRKVERRNIVFENVVRRTKPVLVFSKKATFERVHTELKLKEVVKVDYEIVFEKRLLDRRA